MVPDEHGQGEAGVAHHEEGRPAHSENPRRGRRIGPWVRRERGRHGGRDGDAVEQDGEREGAVEAIVQISVQAPGVREAQRGLGLGGPSAALPREAKHVAPLRGQEGRLFEENRRGEGEVSEASVSVAVISKDSPGQGRS